MVTAIIACALAIAVPCVVGLVLTISASRSFSALSASLTSLSDRLQRCETGLQTTSAAGLRAEVDGLAGDVDALRNYVQRSVGRLDQRLGKNDKQPPDDKQTGRLAPTPSILAVPKPNGGSK